MMARRRSLLARGRLAPRMSGCLRTMRGASRGGGGWWALWGGGARPAPVLRRQPHRLRSVLCGNAYALTLALEASALASP